MLYLKACPAFLEKFPQTVVKDDICTIPNLPRIINLHRNKEKTKCLKTKKEGQTTVVDEVETKEEEEREDKQVPLKRKRKGEEEDSSLKEKMRLKAKDSRDPLYLALTIVPQDQTPKETISLPKSKTTMAKIISSPSGTPPPPLPSIQKQTPSTSKTKSPSPSHKIQTHTFLMRQKDTFQTLVVTLLDPTLLENPSLDDPLTNQGDDSLQELFEDSICDPFSVH
ncbi:hypothetical protein E5676_scaffold14G00820 [Cucumis melo var. makuwa]|uniref:Uncharacterized protein n=2 Tax=Cucumis melo TaxID=3656 RepID=A0A5A7VP61_CUCMM|nr:hypothetical protein E6C27_scaffold38G001190 [Cucumis melo var. makuwa]TYK26305.1 hypothetical protein E5676_scaffold14G00820 [Cucumis melo var. makuwa]